MPRLCACGQAFTVDHALSCSRGGYLASRHNEVRDLLGELVGETCRNVTIEPVLHPLNGEHFRSPSAVTTDEARLDIKAGGFWGSDRHQCAFFDVRVFYPLAHSYRNMPQDRCYRHHEDLKRRAYEERVREVEGGSFTPLVFSSLGGASPATTVFLKRLASLLAEKRDGKYAEMINWLRCRLAFSLVRSAILCIRGSRVKGRHDEALQPTLALQEGRVGSDY